MFIHHEEVFHHVREEFRNGKIKQPIDLVHVDAHSDISNGMDNAYMYMMDTMLNKATINDRYNVEEYTSSWGKLNSGNFILYMIACRMIANLKFVKHLKTSERFPPWFYLNNDLTSGALQLKSYGPNFVLNVSSRAGDLMREITGRTPTVVDPPVPFQEIFYNTYNTTDAFDQIYLTQSPSFTPRTSDALVPIIQQYMQLS